MTDEEQDPHLFDRMLYQHDTMIRQMGELLKIARGLLVVQSLLLFASAIQLFLATFK